MMKFKFRLLTSLLLACCLYLAAPATTASAASGEDAVMAILNYVPNVVMDIAHIFKINVSVGSGHAVDVRATRLLSLGHSMYGDGITRYGLNGRNGHAYEEAIDETGCALLGYTIPEELERDPYEVGITLHLFGGIEAAFNVRSAVDAMTGLFLIDLDDDNADFFGGS